MSKPKTRFVISVNGAAREIYSVRERGSGDLLIVCRTGRNHEDRVDGGDRPQLTDRISVHHSPASTGTTVKSTIELESGERITTASFVRDSKTSLIWPLRFARSQDLSEPRYEASPRNADTIVDLGWYNPQSFTLMHTLVVARRGTALPTTPVFTLHQHHFERFTLGLYVAFMTVPSVPNGDYNYPLTVAEPTEGIPDAAVKPEGADSLVWRQVVDLVATQFSRLASIFIARMEKLTDLPPEHQELFRGFTPVALKDAEDFNRQFAGKVAYVFPTEDGPIRLYVGGAG